MNSLAGGGWLHHGVIAFRGMRIVVRCDTEAPLRWLEEFFGPCETREPEGPEVCEVRLSIDSGRHTAMRRDEHGDQRRIDAFALDGGFAGLTLLSDTPAARLLRDEKSASFVTIGTGGHAVQIVAAADHARVRVLLMRVVRELAMLESLRRGDRLVHAAAAVHRGRAILIAGQKRAGKTTTLLGLLSTGEARYLSNDRVLVDLFSAPPMAYGLPTVAKVRADTLDYLPRLTAPPGGRHYLTSREYDEGSSLLNPTRRPDHSMSPAQLCRWLDVTAMAAAPIGLMVFVRVDPSVERFALRRLDSAEATDRLRDSLFSSGPSGLVSEAFGREWQARTGFDDARLLPLQAQGVTACECRVGPRAFYPPGIWDAILTTAAIS